MSPRLELPKARAYRDFRIGDIFDIKTPAKKYNANTVTLGEGYPYVVRTSSNNAIKGLINEDPKYLNPGNSISFGQDTATINYQPQAYFTGDKIKIMSFKSYKLNEHIANYLISTMRKAFSGFSWGVTSFNESILKDVKISLPVDVNGNLDLQLMEETTRLIDKDYRYQIVSMLNSAGFEDCTLTAEEESALGNYMFKTFDNLCIGDYYQKVELNKRKFDKRKDTRQIPDVQHYIPLVNAKHGDNGIMYYGDPNVFDSVEMTIDIVQNGAIATGDVYPQPQRTGILWDAYLIQAISHKDSIETLIVY